MKRILLLIIFIPVLVEAQSPIGSIEVPDKPVPRPAGKEPAVQAWNQAQTGFSSLPDAAQEFLYWVNYGRSNPSRFWDSVISPVLRAFPELRGADAESLYKDLLKTGPLPMFRLNPVLVRVAQAHANDIAGKKADPSHTSTNGTSFSARIRQAGIRSCANENIALSSNSTLLAVLLLYLDIGLPEKGHRKSLLNESLLETGIGVADYGNEQEFFVQDLSCSQQR